MPRFTTQTCVAARIHKNSSLLSNNSELRKRLLQHIQLDRSRQIDKLVKATVIAMHVLLACLLGVVCPHNIEQTTPMMSWYTAVETELQIYKVVYTMYNTLKVISIE